ncbi:hypothetical protein [Gorillibacterium sp. CAU 1737]|uniref:hypothetical protein n=1 Tax=Gorillibacterium sp. CAU 1737 TaxID=3140362 RepID=UPI0032603E07
MSPDGYREEALLNQSRILFQAGESQFVTYSNTVTTPVVGPNISLVKSSGATQAFPGIPIVFLITITNTGNREADLTIYDLLQDGTEFVPNSVQRDGVPLPGANPVTGLHLGRIGINQMIRVSFQLVASMKITSSQLANQVRGDYTFEASGRIIHDSGLSNLLTLPVIVYGKPDITITFSVNKSQASPGETLRYTAIVSNLGDVAAEVFLQSTIPRGTLFVRNSITVNGVMQSGDFLPATIAIGTIAPRTYSIVTFDVTVTGIHVVTPGQEIPNRARTEGTYRSEDGTIIRLLPSVSNFVSTEVYSPLFQLEVSTSPSTVRPEEIVEYTLHLSNTGNLGASVSLNQLINRQTSLVPGSIRINGVPAPDPDSSGSLYIGYVEFGSTIQITYQVMVSPLVVSRILRGVVATQFSYELNDFYYNGEVISNGYEIYIIHSDE